MRDLEKLLWFGVGCYGVYSAGTAVMSQKNRIDKQGATIANVALLLGLGAMFLIRLDSVADQGQSLLS